MKKSSLGIGIITGIASFLACTGVVWAVQNLPQINRVCESKSGQITAIADGYSSIKRCPAGSREAIIVGEKGARGDKGDKGDQGNQGVAGKGLDLTRVYSKIDGPFTVTQNVPSTIAHGCNAGDLAIGGGLYSYSGNLSNWDTIKSLPATTEPSDVQLTANGWSTTVINRTENGTYSTLTRCISLQ